MCNTTLSRASRVFVVVNAASSALPTFFSPPVNVCEMSMSALLPTCAYTCLHHVGATCMSCQPNFLLGPKSSGLECNQVPRETGKAHFASPTTSQSMCSNGLQWIWIGGSKKCESHGDRPEENRARYLRTARQIGASRPPAQKSHCCLKAHSSPPQGHNSFPPLFFFLPHPHSQYIHIHINTSRRASGRPQDAINHLF